MNRFGYDSIFRLPQLQNSLDIDREQNAEISNRAIELQDQFEKEVAELKIKYREKLNGELTAEQRNKLEKLLGDPSGIHKQRQLKF